MGYINPITYSINVAFADKEIFKDTDYYFGANYSRRAEERQGLCLIRIPKGGIIKQIAITLYGNTPVLTEANIRAFISIWKDTAILTSSTVISNNIADGDYRVFTNKNMNLKVDDTDYIEIQISTNDIAEDPGILIGHGTLIIEGNV